jgi:hypothetical protein
MKRCSRVVGVLILLVAGAAASESAMARGGRGSSGQGGAGHGGGYTHARAYGHGGGYSQGSGYGYGHVYRGARAGIYLGVPLYGLGYYAAPYYSYPAYAYPAPAVAYTGAYVEQGYAQAAPAAQQDWYYCAGSNGYYPYVRECPGGWQRVTALPPPPR